MTSATSEADLIAEAKASRICQVDVDGRQFFVRKMGATEVMRIAAQAREGKPLGVHEWLSMGVCNEDGSPFFTADGALEWAELAGYEAVRLADLVATKAGFGVDAAKN